MGLVGVAPGTTTLQLPDGTAIAIADWIDDQFYSTVQFSAGATAPVEAFSAGRSQPIPGGNRPSTAVDTNIPRAGSNGLPMSWRMLNYSIGIKIVRVERPVTDGTEPQLQDSNGAFSDPATYRTAFNLDRATYFEYQYNGKSYTQGVMQDYPTGHGFVAYATTSAFEVVNNGVPSPRDRNSLVLPIDERENLGYLGSFQPQVPFNIAQLASDEGADLTFADIKVYKRGLIKRPVI